MGKNTKNQGKKMQMSLEEYNIEDEIVEYIEWEQFLQIEKEFQEKEKTDSIRKHAQGERAKGEA